MTGQKGKYKTTGPLTPQFPHLFFLTLWVGTVLNPFGRPGILVTTASKPGCRAAIQNLTHAWKSCTDFRSVYSPKQELSLDESMMPCQGHLKFRTYNPRKITKYWVLVRMVCEAVSGYICNMEIYSDERKKLEEPVLSLLDRKLCQIHHIYKDIFYNIVRLAQTSLDRNVWVHSTMRANRGYCTWTRRERQMLEKRAVSVLEERWRNCACVEGHKTCANYKYDPRCKKM